MKKIFLVLMVISVSFFAQASSNLSKFTKTASNKPILTQTGKGKHWCSICGMSIKHFYKTSHTAKLKDGTNKQYCSMRCLSIDMKKYNIKTKDIKVIDVKSEELIEASKAFYVLGSDVKGTMSKVSKLAFLNKKDADDFVKERNGKVVSFQTALKNANESLNKDIAMIKKKKKKKIYPMGKRIFERMCKKDIDLIKFSQINELKAALKNNTLCKPLKGNKLQILSVYLWEVKRVGLLEKDNLTIKTKKDDKCPVCGMFTYKFPKWTAQIFYKVNNDIHHHSFDGVKDMMKFYFDAMKWGNYEKSKKENISDILVIDYYSQKAIDASKAFFVIGSDIYGPMGKELIPFKYMEDAKTFKKDHIGIKILKFKDIKEEDVYKLDN